MKIYVLGQSGSGKTYFSKFLSKYHKHYYLEMDNLHKKVDYDLDEFYLKINQFLDTHNSWIIDGKYKGIRKRLIEESDKIYFIDLPLSRTIYENFSRQIKSPQRSMLDLPNHIVKVIREFYPVRKEIYKEIENNRNKVTIFKTRKEVNNFINNFNKKKM